MIDAGLSATKVAKLHRTMDQFAQSVSIMKLGSLVLRSKDCCMRSEGHGWNRAGGAHRDGNPQDYVDPV
jgi:hypothetical protein